jgi:hypothetical protein
MTLSAGTDRRRPVHGLLFEWFFVVTAETEFGPVFPHREKKRIRRPMHLMAGKALALFHRRVNHLHFPQCIMALVTQLRPLLRQLEALFSLDRMIFGNLHMTGEAFSIGHRLMWLSGSGDGRMAVAGYAAIRANSGVWKKRNACDQKEGKYK